MVKGLVPAVCHEKRRPQGFKQRDVMDVGIGIMDEGAGFHVAGSVNMEVTPASRDAAVDEFAVRSRNPLQISAFPV